MTPFSELKALWHIDRIAQLRQGRDIVPTHVQLIISDLCNQNCHFCAYRMDGGFSTEKFADEEGNRNPKRFIPSEKVKEILDDCAKLGVGSIEFTGGGEPTVHPQCFDLIDYAQKLGMQTGLVTNAVRLDMAPDAVLQQLTWLRVSLDAGIAETYEAIRASKAWPKVMRQLERLGKMRGPHIGVGFVVTRENFRELEQACALVKATGIPYVRVSAMFSLKGALYYVGVEAEIDKQRSAAKALEDECFKVVDFFDDRINDLKAAKPEYSFCGYQQFVLYIGGDQKVYTCCTNAYTAHGEIGDLRHQRFAEWIVKNRRYDFDAKGCHHCQFNGKNRLINYMLDTNPPHVAFV